MPKFAIINRAPIMTAWSFIVAERLGFQREEALSIGAFLLPHCPSSKTPRSQLFSGAMVLFLRIWATQAELTFYHFAKLRYIRK